MQADRSAGALFPSVWYRRCLQLPARTARSERAYTDARRLAPDELIRQLKDRQIPNLWIPKAENFILVDSLPMLGNGKLDLAALVELAKKYGDKT